MKTGRQKSESVRKANPLIKKYGNSPRWVNYVMQTREGRITKVPFSAVTGRNASSMKAEDWTTYEEVIKTKLGQKGQIGIVFTEEKTLLGIDIDHCLKAGTNEIEHEDKDKIIELVIQADSYTEISPSGSGLHIYLELEGACSLSANRHANFEAYTAGRYFTFTGNAYKEQKDIRKISVEEALALLEIIGYPWGKSIGLNEKMGEVRQNNKPAVSDKKSIGLDDELILKKMFASKGGDKIKALYSGDTSGYKKDGSAADMALLAHLAFWTRKNGAQMLSIWMSSPLGQREKTLTREDYRSRSVINAIKNCKEVYETEAMRTEAVMAESAPELDLLFTTYKGEKIFTQNTENICRILRDHPEFRARLRYDAFKNIFEIKLGESWRDFQDHDTIEIQTRISILFPMFGKVGKEMVYDAIIKVSKDSEIDSARDWVQSLEWDGTDRLKNWISKLCHTPDDIYHKAVGENVLKGLVKRIIDPGCKFDYVLVLEGEQGIRKSTALSVLGGAWYCETTMSTDNKDFFMQFMGNIIIEFSEGETFSRTEIKRMKAIITTQSDKFRPPYGKMTVNFPRRCIFMMTTNQSEYLKDETGNRRWLPVACEGQLDVEWLKENREQLFAEAHHRLTVLKETVYEFPEKETAEAQHTRRIHDPNEDNIAHWYFNQLKQSDRDDGVTVYQAFRDVYCNGMTPQKGLDRGTEMSIAGIFRDVIKLEKRRKMVDGIQGNRWYLKEDSMQSALPIYETPAQKAFEELF